MISETFVFWLDITLFSFIFIEVFILNKQPEKNKKNKK